MTTQMTSEMTTHPTSRRRIKMSPDSKPVMIFEIQMKYIFLTCSFFILFCGFPHFEAIIMNRASRSIAPRVPLPPGNIWEYILKKLLNITDFCLGNVKVFRTL
ncbi:hypothetical protein GDO86_003328 [Hymenochirus boettgeri]|uniref:Uncharacterized protein n=1 Tax=Hymenochirus boettgeri TaxID=247094 RepID=A0A8T2K5A6_9PIPI|nr:hypothetical protein GDO86_003328 [Hymenochirus boettgeri]